MFAAREPSGSATNMSWPNSLDRENVMRSPSGDQRGFSSDRPLWVMRITPVPSGPHRIDLEGAIVIRGEHYLCPIGRPAWLELCEGKGYELRVGGGGDVDDVQVGIAVSPAAVHDRTAVRSP